MILHTPDNSQVYSCISTSTTHVGISLLIGRPHTHKYV